MPAHKTLKIARHAQIQTALRGSDAVSVRELTELLGVSEATVRRDLEDLERSGVVRRTHGGAVPVRELPLPDREGRQVAEKRAIATAALPLVRPGSTCFLGGGTTTLQLAELLGGLDLTVVTNSIPIASSLVTSGLRRFTDATGLDPRALVWVVAVIITGVAYVQGSPALPVFESSNPAEYLSAWLLLATGFSEMAKVIYDRILSGIPVLAGPSSA